MEDAAYSSGMTIDQAGAIDPDRLGADDWTCFWRDPRFHNLECLRASFRTHVYATHTHDTYAIGVIVRGIERFTIGGVALAAGPGDVCVVPPGVPHDGEPDAAEGFSYRMIYPDPAMVGEIADDVFDRPTGTPHFRDIVMRDPETSQRFVAMHEVLEWSPDPLDRDSAMVGAIATLVGRHASWAPPLPRLGDEQGPVARVRDYIAAHLDDEIDLLALAAVGRLGRFQLIRAFKKHIGMTPRAYLLDCRVKAAQRLLRDGMPPADVAAATGFCDQSHLNRAFKARLGVTPGIYRSGRNPIQDGGRHAA